MQTYRARFLVSHDALAGNDILMQVTTGTHGEVLALAVDRDWWRPTFSGPPYRYSIRSWQNDTISSLELEHVMLPLTRVQTFGAGAFLLAAPGAKGIWDPQNAMIVDADGRIQRQFSLSDGIKDVQVD